MLIIQYLINMNFVISSVIVANNEYATECEPITKCLYEKLW